MNKSTHSTPRAEARGMLRVDTERRHLPRFKNRGLAPSNVSRNASVWLFILLFLGVNLTFCLSAQAADRQTTQEQEKKKDPPVQQSMGGVMGGVIGGFIEGTQGQDQGGVIGGMTQKTFDDDFLLEPRKIVTFVIEHLLIKPTETIHSLEKTNLRTEFGIGISYSFRMSTAAKVEFGLKITPTISSVKGIDLKIAVQRDGQTVKEESVLAHNLEPVIVEIFQNEVDHIKLAEKITPFIQTVDPLPNYPKAVEKLEMTNDILIMNNVLLVNNTRGGMLASHGGSESSPIYLHFWIKGKGVYVLSLWPFPGSKPLGVISDSAIRIKYDQDYFVWFSLKPILPEGKWRVWVRHNPNYDPMQEMPVSMSEADRASIKSGFEKENATIAGVGSSYARFFKDK
jgi:hypothetical protein